MGFVSIAVVDSMPFEYAFLHWLIDIHGIFSNSILRELLLKAARLKSSKLSLCWLEIPYYSTGDKLGRCLPALRALTRCDTCTTSKISMKHAAMKAIYNNLTLIQNFKSLSTQT